MSGSASFQTRWKSISGYFLFAVTRPEPWECCALNCEIRVVTLTAVIHSAE